MRYLIPSLPSPTAILSNMMVMLIIIMIMIMIIPAEALHVTDLMIPIALDLYLCLCASTCSNTEADGEITMMHQRPAVHLLILATRWQNPRARFIHIGCRINCLKFVKSIAACKMSQAITFLLLRLNVCGLFVP